ncbi:MAG: sigma-70 family RNA polymerase sigma factor [Clostridia bacterium]|nr:sigma-70 family RNA polymerase sigma factor [Clostridia bacterium]
MLILLTQNLSDDEKEKITQIYYEYRKLMMAIALKYFKDSTKAEDVVQESFFKIRKNLTIISSLTGNKQRAYIVYIVKSVSIDYLRKNSRQSKNVSIDETFDIESADYSPYNELYLKEIRLNISRILLELDERDANVLIGKFYYGYTTKELCEMFEVESQNTMLSIIHRARKKFIKLLSESEDTNE